MNDHDALLRAICENPREDTPRLAFADWLEENGQPERAAFIRTDIAMSLRDEWDADRLRWEEGLTLGEFFRLPWNPAATQPLPDGCTWAAFPATRRGMLWSVTFTDSDRTLASHPDILTRHPVERLRFVRHAPNLKKLATRPGIERASELEFHVGGYPGRTIDPLLNRKAFAHVESLCFWANALPPPAGEALCGSEVFGRLSELRIGGHSPRVTVAVLERLTAPAALRLRKLELRSCLSSTNGAQRLAAGRLPESLHTLELPSNRLNGERVAELALLGALVGLRILNLAYNPVGNAGATALFTSPHLAGLKVLDLSYCQVGDEALRELLENSPLADGLNLLNLTGSPGSADMKQAVKDRMGDRVRL